MDNQEITDLENDVEFLKDEMIRLERHINGQSALIELLKDWQEKVEETYPFDLTKSVQNVFDGNKKAVDDMFAKCFDTTKK